MSDLSGDTLYRAVTSSDINYSTQLIMEFKAHIKRDLVDISNVPKYFESLIIAYNIPSLSINSFSTVCHLVKRVSIQDPSALKSVYLQVVPFLIDRLLEEKLSLRNTAKKALVSYWQSLPFEFETTLKEYGLRHSDKGVRNEILSMLFEIVENTPGFSFKTFLSDVVLMIDDLDLKVSENVSNLLVLFFKVINPNNKTAKNDLINQLVKSNIDKNNATRLLMQIDDELVHNYNNVLNQSLFVSAGSTKITASGMTRLIDRPKSRLTHYPTSQQRPQQRLSDTQRRVSSGTLQRAQQQQRKSSGSFQKAQSPKVSDDQETIASSSDELKEIYAALPGSETDESIKPIDFTSESNLMEKFESMLSIFDGRETEFNWTGRERLIVQMRSILRGNAPTDYPSSLSQAFRTVKECIVKAISSLRTTISNHGCQLSKELGVYLGPYVEATTTESLTSALIKVTSARKIISNQNANVAIISLLMNTSFNSRVLTQIHLASQDKNKQPRAYSGSWIHVLLLRYKTQKSVLETDQTLEILEKSISKGIADPAPAARENMRLAYWCLNDMFPAIAERILNKADNNVIKALEKVRPLSSGNAGVVPAINNRLSDRATSIPSVDSFLTRQREELRRQKEKEKDMEDRERSKVSRERQSKSYAGLKQHDGLSSTSQGAQRSASDPKPRSISRTFSGSLTTTSATAMTAGTRSSSLSTRPTSRKGSSGTRPEIRLSLNEKENDNNDKTDDFTSTFTISNPVQLPKQQEKEKSPVDDHTDRFKSINSIYEQLASHDKSEQEMGFNTWANRSDRDSLGIRFNSVMNKLSVMNASVFFPIFCNESTFKSVSKYMSTDNLIRITCVYNLNNPLNSLILSYFIKSIPIDDLCFSIVNTMALSIDYSKSDDLNLLMQFEKHKIEFLETCFWFITELLIPSTSMKLESYLIGAILETLFQCWELVSDSPALYINLMQLCLTSHEANFKRCFIASDDIPMKEALSERLTPQLHFTNNTSAGNKSNEEYKLDSLLSSDNVSMTDAYLEDAGNAEEMTKILNIGNNLKPVKSDMTMIIPNLKKLNNNSNSLEQIGEEDEELSRNVADDAITGNLPEETENPFIEASKDVHADGSKLNYEIDDVFKDNDEEYGKMDVDLSLGNSDHSGKEVIADDDEKLGDRIMSDTTPNLDNLTLTEHSKMLVNSSIMEENKPTPSTQKAATRDIDTIIESADPLASLTKSSEKIEIYEDNRPLEELDSWFDFELYKTRKHGGYDETDKPLEEDYSYNQLLEKMANNEINNKELFKLIAVIDSGEQPNCNLKKLQASLMGYLNPALSRDKLFVGLILTRSCILQNDEFEIRKVFNKLVELSSATTTTDDELYFALSETFGLIPNLELYIDSCSDSRNAKPLPQQLLLEQIVDLLNPETMTSENIFKIDFFLNRLLNSKVTRIRKMGVLIYAIFLKFKKDESKKVEEQELIDDLLFKKLDPIQYKLVEFYADRV